MFRNVTGVQEAVVHRQSEDSLGHEGPSVKLIKDVQSDNIARTYVALKSKWFRERERLTEQLKQLETQRGFPQDIQRVKNTIECLNTLIDNGDLSKHCQALIDQLKTSVEPIPETHGLTRKPLGEKTIRLPRHVSVTALDQSTASEVIQEQKSKKQVRHPKRRRLKNLFCRSRLTPKCTCSKDQPIQRPARPISPRIKDKTVSNSMLWPNSFALPPSILILRTTRLASREERIIYPP